MSPSPSNAKAIGAWVRVELKVPERTLMQVMLRKAFEQD